MLTVTTSKGGRSWCSICCSVLLCNVNKSSKEAVADLNLGATIAIRFSKFRYFDQHGLVNNIYRRVLICVVYSQQQKKLEKVSRRPYINQFALDVVLLHCNYDIHKQQNKGTKTFETREKNVLLKTTSYIGLTC